MAYFLSSVMGGTIKIHSRFRSDNQMNNNKKATFKYMLVLLFFSEHSFIFMHDYWSMFYVTYWDNLFVIFLCIAFLKKLYTFIRKFSNNVAKHEAEEKTQPNKKCSNNNFNYPYVTHKIR